VGLVVVVVGGVQRGWMQKDRSNPGFELGIWVISSDLGGPKICPKLQKPPGYRSGYVGGYDLVFESQYRFISGAKLGFRLIFEVRLRNDCDVHAWAWRQLPLCAQGVTGWALELPVLAEGLRPIRKLGLL